MFILFEAQYKIIVEPKALLGSYWVHPTKTTPPTNPQLSIKSKQVYTSPTSTYDTFLDSLGQDLSNPAYIGLISGAILIPHP